MAAPDVELAGAKRPPWLPVASRSFCSRASARLLRKSERWTSPTVWDLRRSSAVAAWEVKRCGVTARDRSVDEVGDVILGTGLEKGLEKTTS